MVCLEIPFSKIYGYAKQICQVTFILPKLCLKKLIKKQLNFSNSIFCSMWKTATFDHFFRLSFPKVLYKSALLSILEVPYKSVLLSITICRHLSLIYHTQKFFTKAFYYLAKNVSLCIIMSLIIPRSIFSLSYLLC